jgi:tetratricopeptide (TPR) repeat protein
MRVESVFVAIAAIAICLAPGVAQDAAPGAASRPAAPTLQSPKRPSKMIDIGAAEAPLSGAERMDLEKAVERHDYAGEKAVIDQAMAEHPDSFALLAMAGRLAYLERHPADSASWLERADKLKPLGETDRMTLALAYAFSEKVPEARAQLQRLMKAAPQNAEYPYLLGRVEVQNQRLEQGVVQFQKAIQLNPDLVRAYEDLGKAQENLGLADAARKTYEAGAARNRERIHWEWSPLDLGVLLLKAGDLDQAEKLFDEALQYNPRFGWAHYYAGQLLQQRGKSGEAMEQYEEAVVCQPDLRQGWLALGREFTRLGKTEEADKALAIFKKLESEDNARKGRKN